jgi:predicted dehydrogenase
MLHVGIVGTGYTVGIANAHLCGYQSCADDCKVVALYDIIPDRAKKWAEEKKINVTICSSFEELLGMVDVVSICTPNYSHIDLVKKAILSGKHVLCEKPLSLNSENCMEVVRLEKSISTITMIGFSYRGIPAVQYLRQLVQEGRFGKVFTWRETLGGCRIANPEVKLEWRMQEDLSGSGALADFGCHMIDLCDWTLSGTSGAIDCVQGFSSTMINQRKEIFSDKYGLVTNDDSAVFNLKFESGTLASFVASRLGVKKHTIELYGEGGMALFRDDLPDQLEVWYKDKNGGYQGNSEIIEVPKDLIISPWFNAEIAEFIKCIKTSTKPAKNFERALYIQKILDAIILATDSETTVRLGEMK